MTSNTSNTYFAKTVLLADGWANNVLIQVSGTGEIESIEQNLGTERFARTNDMKTIDGILIPGLVNLHSHAFQRAFAGLTESRGQPKDSFWSWRKIMYQFVDQLTPDHVYIIARHLYIEMLKAGYTSVAEFHYLHHDAKGGHYGDAAEMSHQVVRAALDVGIEITLLPVYYRYSGFGELKPSTGQRRFIHQPDDYYRLIDTLYTSYGSHPAVNVGIAPHSLRAVNGDDINQAVEVLNSFNQDAPIHIHIAEQMAEVDDCIAHTGQRPVQHLYDQCEVNSRWCLIHATHVNEQETWEMADSGAVAGLCLTTEANLGDGIFPADFYLQQQGAFGIGSDSHSSVNAIEELRLLEYGQRLTHRGRAILCDEITTSVGRTLFQGATRGGAQAVAKNTGKIDIGMQADWLVLDESNSALFSKTEDQILDAMIFSSNTSPIKEVVVSGKWIIKDYSHALEQPALNAFRKILSDLV